MLAIRRKAETQESARRLGVAEYEVLDDMKQRAGKLGVAVKKTELIRAGIKALAAMANPAFLAAVDAVPSLKTGRPSKSA